MGFVTVTIILLTGCCPASAITFILGNVISGKRAVFILLYANNPPKMMMTRMRARGFLCLTKFTILLFPFLTLYYNFRGIRQPIITCEQDLICYVEGRTLDLDLIGCFKSLCYRHFYCGGAVNHL